VFTGIVERLGKVTSARDRSGGRELTIAPVERTDTPRWKPVVLGESVSVSGVCLTASRVGRAGREASFDVVPETLSRTTIGRLRTGDTVNLERSLLVGDPLGGHFVTGHVDGLGKVLARSVEGDQVLFRIGAPPDLLALMIPKGSVAVDGISLTVVEVDGPGRWFSFVAIPHTLEWTTLGRKRVRDEVNLEADALGKWVIRGIREIFGAVPETRSRIARRKVRPPPGAGR
jgi:riboflavin synthase